MKALYCVILVSAGLSLAKLAKRWAVLAERPWRQKPAPLDTFVTMKMDSAS